MRPLVTRRDRREDFRARAQHAFQRLRQSVLVAGVQMNVIGGALRLETDRLTD